MVISINIIYVLEIFKDRNILFSHHYCPVFVFL